MKSKARKVNMDAICDAIVKLLRAKFHGQTYVLYNGVSIEIRENEGDNSAKP